MDAFTATILPVGFSWAPKGWSLCQGQSMSIGQYTAVYSLIGLTYGGDYTRQIFNIPDLQGRMPLGYGQSPGSSINYPWGNKGGHDIITLTPGQMPPHSHPATFTPTGTATISIPAQKGSQTATLKANSTVGTLQNPASGSALAGGSSGSTKIYATSAASAASQVSMDSTSVTISGNAPTAAQTVTTNAITGGAVSVGISGTGAAIDARPPYLAINFIFCIQGLYPEKP